MLNGRGVAMNISAKEKKHEQSNLYKQKILLILSQLKNDESYQELYRQAHKIYLKELP